MSETTLISVRLPSEVVQLLDSEAETSSRPGARVTRTDVIVRALSEYFEIAASDLPQDELLGEALPQKPYKCPGTGCNMRSDSKAAICPTHGRKVVPVG